MEWMDLASQFFPVNENAPTGYEQFRMFLDSQRTWIIFVELIAVYYLGFATQFRMPILKMLLLYLALFAGALIFAVLDVLAPVKSVLLLAMLVLMFAKLRKKRKESTTHEVN